MKQCNKCNEVKELTEFCKKADAKDGCYPSCRSCGNAYAKQYREKNKELVKRRKSEYHQKNKEKIAAKRRKRYATDPTFKIRTILHARLNHALNGTAKAHKTLELLGCTAEHVRFHIESQMTEGMTWENIHIDHIQPCASFDLASADEQRKCFHYTNLQPLFASDNLRKSDQIVPEHQVRLL